MTHIVWAGDSKTGLGIKIGPRQQKLWQHPNVQLIGNPAVRGVSSGGVATIERQTSLILVLGWLGQKVMWKYTLRLVLDLVFDSLPEICGYMFQHLLQQIAGWATILLCCTLLLGASGEIAQIFDYVIFLEQNMWILMKWPCTRSLMMPWEWQDWGGMNR